MKRRNRTGHQRFASRGRKALGPLAKRSERKRKSWSFERLEDRLVFSVDPLNLQTYSFSSDTSDGAALTLLDEMRWAQMQAASASGTASGTGADAGADATPGATKPPYVVMSLPSDPLFQDQWHLLNTGQEVGNPDLQHLFGVAGEDINVVPAWNMLDANGDPIDGSGVTVAVIDTGVQLFHPDLAGNISPTLRFNPVTGTNNVNPSLIDPDGGHGTSVAGIIAAVANNGEGGTGVAPGATIVPIKADTFGGFFDQDLEEAFLYALQHDVDITNNSYGPGGRVAFPVDPAFLTILRDSVISGRGGLGMINVFASGNDGGPGYFGQGFPQIGTWSSASYNPLVNSRFTIGVGGVDHDGLYINADGTFTSYPESGPSVLVAAPTGSNGRTNIADDDGYGSGIWTTDLFGDFGFNAAPLPNGFDPDRDLLPDPNYTSRFNGTSASAPMVSGVIALMLQANPNLTYRDVQEILVRSSRQNAQFESPTTGGVGTTFAIPKNTWQTNQTGPFRNPDSFFNPLFDGFNFDTNPIADPNTEPVFNAINTGFPSFRNFTAPSTNDDNRQFSSIYEPEPALFTNGAGYTVSQGYGIYGEQLGYAHGVVDAAAAVAMAKQWHTLGQNLDPNTELTYTTGVVSLGSNFNIHSAEKGAAPPNGDQILVPGGIGSDPAGGFIAYWNQYFANPPFANYTGPPPEARGFSYLDFAVPPTQEMNVEWVEVKVDLSGAGATSVDGLNALRIMLVSPDGTQSELNNYYPNASWAPDSTQPSSSPANGWQIDLGQGLNGAGGNFTWTFSTNRSFGESSNSEVLLHPVTGEPILQEIDTFDFSNPFLPPVITNEPIFRNWEVHFENWSHSSFNLNGIEVVWHGKPVAGGTYDPNYGANGIISGQRIQGFVGIDQNGDNDFNFNRSVQTLVGQHADVSDLRVSDVSRQLDFNDNNSNQIFDAGDTINQEKFAANVIVDAYKVWGGVPEASPTARFLTGADGNYYFDLDVQGDLAQTKQLGGPHFGQTIEYQIRATDQNEVPRQFLNDVATPALVTSDPGFTYLPHYKDTWTINPNWFFAPDHDNPLLLANDPGEVFYDATGAANAASLLDPTDLPEPGLGAPRPWNNFATLDHIIPAPVKNLNFLIKDDAPANQFDVTGTVYSDVNGNGVFDGTDAAASNISVYWDKDRNGVHDAGEPTVVTDANGQYSITLDLTTLFPVPTSNATYQIGVIKPTADWAFTDPGQDGVETVFAGPGSPAQLVNFFLQPPNDQNPFGNGPGTIQGVIFNDLSGNGVQEIGEPGVANFRVFIDTNLDGAWDSANEVSVLSGSNGAYFFPNVQPGLYRIDIVIANEGTPNAAWDITSPTVGFRDVQLLAGGSITGVTFGLVNLADRDWGDLPDSYQTTSASNGPSHKVQIGFRLGATIDGEVNGVPSSTATTDDSDDGVLVVSNGGVLESGVNTLRVTVFGVGGLLTGWMDFNNNGHFDGNELLTWTLNGNDLGGEADLNPGTYDLQITIPGGAVNGLPIASRFRWGEHSGVQGPLPTGPAEIGEVEDYFFGLNFIFGDYNRNGVVDAGDEVLWKKTKGQNVAPFSGADGNGDGVINDADHDVWKAHFGEVLPPPGAGAIVATAGDSASSNSSSAGAALAADYSALSNHSSGATAGQSFGVFGPAAAIPPTQQTDVTVATAPSVSSGSSLVSSPLFAAFDTGAGQPMSVESTSTSVVHVSTVNTASSNSDLLLLDQTWGDLDHNSYAQADESMYDDQTHETVCTNDLALAAVLKEDDDWWSAI